MQSYDALSKIQCFPKKRRLLRKSDFLETTSGGKRIFTKNLILFFKPNNLGYIRIGIVVNRKFGHAAARNRFKRLIRETFRLTYSKFDESVDIVVIAKNDAVINDRTQCEEEFKSAFRKFYKNTFYCDVQKRDHGSN